MFASLSVNSLLFKFTVFKRYKEESLKYFQLSRKSKIVFKVFSKSDLIKNERINLKSLPLICTFLSSFNS